VPKKQNNDPKPKRPVGRPLIQIDQKQFETMCALQCTLSEFAAMFSCSEDIVENWCKRTYGMNFTDVFKLKRGSGKTSLRRKQYEKAMAGDTALLIFLGMNWLNQRDKHEHTGKDGERLSISALMAKVESEDEQEGS